MRLTIQREWQRNTKYLTSWVNFKDVSVCCCRQQPRADTSRCRSSRWRTTGAPWWTVDVAAGEAGAEKENSRPARRPARQPSGSASRSTSRTSPPSALVASATYLVTPSARTLSPSPTPSLCNSTSPSDGRWVLWLPENLCFFNNN